MARFLARALLLLCAAAPACAAGGDGDPAGEGRAALESGAPATTAKRAPIESFYVVLAGAAAVKSIPKGVDPRSPEAAVATRARLAAIEVEQAALTPAIERLGGKVVARLSRLANAVQVLADDEAARRMERLPGVARVERVPLVRRALASALPVVRAPAAWAGPPMLQGDGITIGIIDSGLDYTHADFAGIGTSDAYLANDPDLIEPGSFPTAKVVGGWDFVGDAYNPDGGQTAPQPDPDPLDCTTPGGDVISGGHGTHVAGIAAGTGVLQDGSSFDGPYEASFNPTIFRVAPGVAPRAKLFSLKIFGCEGSTSMLGAALDRAADPNLDGNFDDRLDVVNASLGTSYGLSTPIIGQLVTELTGVGTLLVAAAGNEGQNFFVTSAPASYPEALSVAASVDNELLNLVVTAPASAAAEYPAAEAAFTAKLASVGPIEAEIAAASPALACAPLANAAELSGKIALIDRGTGPFVDTGATAGPAGASAVEAVGNVDDALPFVMGGADPGTSPIPGVMVRLVDGAALKAALAQGPVTIALDAADRYDGPGAELLAGFSSRGPSAMDGRLKPEIAAPGVAIDSAGVGTGTEPRQLQGTSMASPVVAGAAALVREAQPAWSPLEVKAALVNTTAPLADQGLRYGTTVVGSGRLDVQRASRTLVTAAADPTTGEIGVSFGAVIVDEPTTVTRAFVVTNHGASAVTLGASVEPTFELPGVGVTVAPPSVDVPPGQTATLELTLALDPVALGAPGPDPGTPAMQGNQTPTPRHFLNQANGLVRLAQAGADDVVVPYEGTVRAAARRKAAAPSACAMAAHTPGDPIEIALAGGGAHPEPVVSAFQLGALDDPQPGADTDPTVALGDLRAVGVATDLATAPSFGEAQVFFGVAIGGTWTTPARGPISIVAIRIDSDQKGGPEFEIRVEARNPNAPYRDSLVASTYDLATGERVSRHPINVYEPDIAATYPFESSVLVLGALLGEIGVDPANPVFDWIARTESPELSFASDQVVGTFDAAHPLVDTARYGLGGAPLFVGSDPVRVDLPSGTPAADAPLDVLLLHHTNVPGERWEVVSLAPKGLGNLAIEAQAPAEIAAGATVPVTLVVTSSGEAPAPNVSVTGSVAGGELVGATTDQGDCSAGPALSCALGELAPGASVTITASVRAAAGGGAVVLDAAVAGDLECESTLEDNASAVTVAAVGGPDVPKSSSEDRLQAGGGCGCRVGERGGSGSARWLLAALGIVALRSARKRRGVGRS